MSNLRNNIMQEDMKQICSSSCVDFNKLINKRVLITGATGLIGSVLVKSLLYFNNVSHEKIKISIIARNPEKVAAIYGNDFNDNLDVIYGDLNADIEATEHIDFIIHLASNTNSKYMISNPVETLNTSIDGTRRMLKLAADNKSESMVYVSSMEVYGITAEEDNPVTEDQLGYIDIHNVRSSYSEGKRICELLCSCYAAEYDVPVKIARLAQTFGAGVPDTDTRVFAQFAKSVIEQKDIVLHTRGESSANYCYTADVAEGILCILTNGTSGEAYNVVNEKTSMKIRDVADMVANNLSGGSIKVVYDIPESNLFGYAPDTKLMLSGEKLRKLGWKPHYDLLQMYERMIDCWK